jgi:putative flippase GtrA
MTLLQRIKNILYFNSVWGEFFRYLIVGGMAFIADYGTLLFLNKVMGLHYLTAATFAFCIGILVNYLGSVKFVFLYRGMKNVHLERGLFLIIGLIGLVINDSLLFLLTGVADIPVEYSKLLTQVLVLFWNFAARKFVLFSQRGKNESR